MVRTSLNERIGRMHYRLTLINKEVRIMFESMIHEWLADYDSGYNDFIKTLFQDDVKAMNVYINRVSLATFNVMMQLKSRGDDAMILEFRLWLNF